MKQIIFDFKERFMESMGILEYEILFTSGRSHLQFDNMDTSLLIAMLRDNVVAVFEQQYQHGIDYPDEIEEKAAEASLFLPRRSTVYPIQAALSIFAPHEPEKRRSVYNALFFPGLKAFVRFGDLEPNRLLEMLNEPDCDKVYVFPYAGDSYYSFELRITKEQFNMVMKNLGELKFERIANALDEANQKRSHVFPEIPNPEDYLSDE